MALPGFADNISCLILTTLKTLRNSLVLACRVASLIAFSFAALVTHAQTINGSVYSYFGVGSLQGRTAAYNRAMGNTGIAVRDDNNLSAVNPASYNSLAKPFTTIFEMGATYETIKHIDETNSSSSKAGGLTSINLLFKLTPKWGLVAGVFPITSINYKASSPRNFGNLQPVAVSYEGSGGVNQFYIGNAYEVFKNFSVGLNFSYYLGTIKRTENVPATAVTDQLYVTSRKTAHNLGFDTGIQYSFLVKQKTKITLGATYDPGTVLDGNQETSIVNSNLDTLKKTEKVVTTYRLPPAYGAGLAVKSGRSTVAADVSWTNWLMAEVNDGQTYRDSWRYSLGYELRGNLSATKYLQAIAFRAGAFVQDYPIVLKNTPFQSWGYTVGLSLPVDGYRASINVNYCFTQMGTTKAGLVQENSNRLVLDFIIRDVWGIRHKLD